MLKRVGFFHGAVSNRGERCVKEKSGGGVRAKNWRKLGN
jgi:hypothetical protein